MSPAEAKNGNSSHHGAAVTVTTVCLFEGGISAQGWALAAPRVYATRMAEAVSPGATPGSAEVNRDFIFLF